MKWWTELRYEGTDGGPGCTQHVSVRELVNSLGLVNFFNTVGQIQLVPFKVTSCGFLLAIYAQCRLLTLDRTSQTTVNVVMSCKASTDQIHRSHFLKGGFDWISKFKKHNAFSLCISPDLNLMKRPLKNDPSHAFLNEWRAQNPTKKTWTGAWYLWCWRSSERSIEMEGQQVKTEPKTKAPDCFIACKVWSLECVCVTRII